MSVCYTLCRNSAHYNEWCNSLGELFAKCAFWTVLPDIGFHRMAVRVRLMYKTPLVWQTALVW